MNQLSKRFPILKDVGFIFYQKDEKWIEYKSYSNKLKKIDCYKACEI